MSSVPLRYLGTFLITDDELKSFLEGAFDGFIYFIYPGCEFVAFKIL